MREGRAATILYSTALDCDRKQVHARVAPRDGTYCCPGCGGAFTLRRSERTGKGAKRPHFAHRADSPNCRPESVLHDLFKQNLAAELDSRIRRGERLPIAWACEFCNGRHEGDLLRDVAVVRVEHDFGPARADIALLAADYRATKVIEIVVTHAPERSTLAYYDAQGIHVICVELKSEDQLDDVCETVGKCAHIRTCRNPRCRQCGNYQEEKFVWVIDVDCYRCHRPMIVAVGKIGNDGVRTSTPRSFEAGEIAIARSAGALLQQRYGATEGSRYLAAVCPHCAAFSGDHYVGSHYAAYAAMGELPYRSTHAGWHCNHCDGF